MKVPRIRIRTFLIVIAVAALVMAGVVMKLRKPGRPYSAVMAGFDPSALFDPSPEYIHEGEAGMGTFNPASGDAEKEWRGVISGKKGPSTEAILYCIEEYLKKVSQGRFHSERSDPNKPPKHPLMPSHAIFLYNEQEWHGEMRVWLLPDSSGTSASYAIFLREERLDRD